MALACLATIEPYDAERGRRIALHVSSMGDRVHGRQVNGLGGHIWEPALKEAPVLGLTLWNGDFRNAVRAGSATLPLVMGVARKSYDFADRAAWIGAPVAIYAEEPGTPWPWPLRFSGRVDGFARKGNVLALSCEVDAEPFAANVLTRTYAGTGGAEGGEDLKDSVKPLVLGWAMNVEPVLIDADNSVYQFSGYGPIEAVTTLYERGSDFGAALGDALNYTSLVASAIPPGRWATCLAEGMIRLGAPAYGVITGDVKGHVVGSATPRLTGSMIQAFASLAGVDTALLDTASLDAMDADVPFPVNVVIRDQVSFLEQAQAMALACNHVSGMGLTGKFFVAAVSLDGNDVLTLDARGRASPQVIASDEADVSVPYWRTVLGANQAWRVHGADEIAYGAALVERGRYDAATTYRDGNIVDLPDGSRWLYVSAAPGAGNDPPTWPATSNAQWENLTPPLSYADGTLIEDLRPAEVGATLGAPLGTPVGDKVADDVASTVKDGGGVAEDQVDTTAVQVGAITVPDESVWADAFVSAGGTVEFETEWLTVGDEKGGQAVAQAFGEVDSGTTIDVGGRINLYVDTGSGYGSSLATGAHGARTVDGDTYSKGTPMCSASLASVSTVRFKLTITSITMPGSSAKSFTFRSPKVLCHGAKR